MPASLCDACAAEALYYRDETNHRYLCKPCYLGDRTVETTRTLDLSEAHKLATDATGTADKLRQFLAVRAETDEQAVWCRDQAKMIKQARTALEAKRDEGAKPAYAVYKWVRELFASPIETLETIEKHLLGQAQAHKRRREDETRAALAAAQSPQDVAAAVAVIVPEIVPERAHWVAEIVDAAAVPREFWIFDQAKADQYARAAKDTGAMPPGLRAVNRKVAVNR